MKILIFLGLCILSIGCSQAQEEEGRVLSLFNVVRFQNDQCKGTSMNGTCYTKQECKDRGGTESGNCAEGFGVCCIISLACGGSSHDNNTYLVKSSVTAGTTCSYQICPASSKICRIRYDFTTHTLASNAVATTVLETSSPKFSDGNAGAAGNCVSDTFSIANMGGDNPPVICGTNDGQHMILDTDGQSCQDALFTIGSDTHTRKWDIHVTQYTCEEMETAKGAGPSGCLQYHTGSSGHFASFAFPITASLIGSTKVGSTVTHLNNQDYKICFRKESGKGKMCYTPLGLPTTLAITDQGTFGVSGSPDAMYTKPGQDSLCYYDYLEFSGGVYPHTSAVTDSTTQSVGTTARTKLCGRQLAATQSGTGIASDLKKHETVCSVSAPYEIRVRFDGYESHGLPVDPTAKSKDPTVHLGCGTAGSTTGAKLRNAGCESSGAPSGHIGFGLIYNQYT